MGLVSGVRGLLFAHNTSPQRLAREAQMGGAPMPSIAITKEGVPFSNFGDITLIGDPKNFDPSVRANKAFSSDAYTVRAPSPVQMAKKDAYKQFADDFADYKELGGTDQVRYALEALERKGGVSESNFSDFSRFFEGGAPIKAKFLDEKGINIRDAEGKIDRRKVNEEFTGLDAEFNQWSQQQVQKYVEPETYFISNPDRDYVTGRPKLVEYTADNVADWMAKRGGKNQESGFGQAGVAAQRASESRQLKSLDDIKALRESVVDEETLEAAKKATEDKFFDLAEKLRSSYKYDPESFRYFDEVGEMIIGMNDRNAQKMLREFGFEDASAELVQEIKDYRKMLQDSPVGYMESKPERVVQLDEYAGAVVPEGTDQATLSLLEDAGLQVKTYDPDVPKTRTAARDSFRNQMFQVGGLGTAGLLGGASLVVSPESEAGAATQFIRLLEAGYPESTARKIMSGELPMDEASRMARAREQGYDTEVKRFRGISEDYSVEGANIPTTWTSENPTMASEYAMGYGGNAPNVMPVITRSENTLNLGIRASEVELKPEDIADRVSNRLYERLMADEISEKDYEKGVEAIWNWEESLPNAQRETSTPVYQFWNKDKKFVNALKEAGFDSIEDYEYTAISHGWGGKPDAKNLGLLDESQVRSTSAAFDPDEIDNPNIMASPASVGAVGGLLASEAATPESQLNPLLAVPAEIGSALNEALVGTVDFLVPDTVNAVSELIGSEYRMPRLSDQELVRLYSQGGYMDEGYGRDAIRTATGLLSPL